MKNLERIFENVFEITNESVAQRTGESVFDIDKNSIPPLPQAREKISNGAVYQGIYMWGGTRVARFKGDLSGTSKSPLKDAMLKVFFMNDVYNFSIVNQGHTTYKIETPWSGRGGSLTMAIDFMAGGLEFIVNREASIKDFTFEDSESIDLFTKSRVDKITIHNTTLITRDLRMPLDLSYDFKNFTVEWPYKDDDCTLNLFCKDASKSKTLNSLNEIIEKGKPSNKKIEELLGMKGVDLKNVQKISIRETPYEEVAALYRFKNEDMVNKEWSLIKY